MSPSPRPKKFGVASLRARMVAAMMLIVSASTGLGLYLAQRDVAAEAQRDLRQNFQAELLSLHNIQNLRNAALTERCHTLVANPRLHAALEDNALDLLYPSAKDELRDLIQGDGPSVDEAGRILRSRFYRFLNRNGAVLQPPNPKDVGELSAAAESELALERLPQTQQIGYLSRAQTGGGAIDEVLAIPIFSSENGDVISALVVGFEPLEPPGRRGGAGMKSGIWVNGRLQFPSLSPSAQPALTSEIASTIQRANRSEGSFTVKVDNAPQLLFYKNLNPNSFFPPAYEICVYPLSDYIARQHRLRWQIGGAGALLLIGGFLASRSIATRLSKPVEKLAIDSEQNRVERKRAEAALESTSEELQRTARYSADASHQLKSPVTVLRAGLETLLGREDFKPEIYEELSALLHQTYRLTGVIDDLLLLSRMDAGHLHIEVGPVNLTALIEGWLDDLSAMPDSLELRTTKQFPPELYVAGERRYTSLIVQNLLENARNYNRSGGSIQISAVKEKNWVALRIGNTGRPIPREAQEHIFERFHRWAGNGNTSGHGLGLNLARELTRLHGGELRLVRSDKDWTEFEVRFRPAPQGAVRATDGL